MINCVGCASSIQLSSRQSPHPALSIPEIVAHIISYLAKENSSPSVKSLNPLYTCLFVNKLWHDCAARFLWREVTFEDTKTDYDAFLKFASVTANTPVTTHVTQSLQPLTFTAALAVAAPTQTKNTYKTRQNQADPADSFFAPPPQANNHASQHAFYTPHKELVTRSGRLKRINQAQYDRLKLYRHSLRSLSLRKIKDKAIIDPVVQIGQNAIVLERLEIYICDHITNEAVLSFLPHHRLTQLTLAGCHLISDKLILELAKQCPDLQHLDLRACGLVSDTSISEIAIHCPKLRHLNVGRIRDRELITVKSIGLIAKHTQVTVLGLAGCDINDECMLMLAKYRANRLERISVNNCHRLTNKSIAAYVQYCPNLSVFEMKECHLINDWESVAKLVNRKVLLTLCDQQSRACADWAKRNGCVIHVKAPIK